MFLGRYGVKHSISTALQAFTVKIASGTIGNIAKKKECKKELTEGKGHSNRNDDNDKGMKRGAGLPGDGFETGIGNITDH